MTVDVFLCWCDSVGDTLACDVVGTLLEALALAINYDERTFAHDAPVEYALEECRVRDTVTLEVIDALRVRGHYAGVADEYADPWYIVKRTVTTDG